MGEKKAFNLNRVILSILLFPVFVNAAAINAALAGISGDDLPAVS